MVFAKMDSLFVGVHWVGCYKEHDRPAASGFAVGLLLNIGDWRPRLSKALTPHRKSFFDSFTHFGQPRRFLKKTITT
jgi:hypothetical protein